MGWTALKGIALKGNTRITRDIDFEAHPQGSPALRVKRWALLENAIKEASRETGITPEYSENIDRWSGIAFPPHRQKAKPYKKFSSVTVDIMDIPTWAVGKLARYLESDISDLVFVLKREKPDPTATVRLWAKALAISPPSSGQELFKSKVLHFIREFGPAIWGKSFDITHHAKPFLDSAKRYRKHI